MKSDVAHLKSLAKCFLQVHFDDIPQIGNENFVTYTTVHTSNACMSLGFLWLYYTQFEFQRC